jgi:hypothetical protein
MSSAVAENKILLRHYGFNNYYAVDRELPDILDISKNGHNGQWEEFCDKLDMTFKHVNTLQSLVFHCKLAVVAVAIIYVIMVLLVYAFPPPLLILYVIAVFVVLVAALNIVVQGPINKKCIGKAMAFVKEENEKRTLQTISGSAVEVSFVHRKLNWLKCEGYELDSQECQRYPNIYIELHSVGKVGNVGNNYIKVNTNSNTGNNYTNVTSKSTGNTYTNVTTKSIGNNYTNVTTKSTGNNYTNVTTKSTGNNYTNVKTDAENPPVATVASAYVSKKVAPTSNAKTVTKNPPVATVASAYVSKKSAATKKANYVNPNATASALKDQIEQEKGRSLQPYVSAPMAKATIIDTPKMPLATKVEEDLPSAYVTKK